MNGCSKRVTSCGVPLVMTRFSARTATRVLSANSVSRSCVTITTVRPSAACSSRSSSQNSSELFGSRPAVGSSSSNSGGSMTSARASATRLIMPPDRSDGMRVACSGFRPTMRSLTMAASQIRSLGRVPCSRSAKATLSSTLNAENSAPCWNSMPTRLAAPARPISEAGRPSTVTLPLAGRVSPSIWRSSTVLPVPEPPTSARISPRRTVRSRFSCTAKASSPLPNTVERPRISTTGGASFGGGSGAAAGPVAMASSAASRVMPRSRGS